MPARRVTLTLGLLVGISLPGCLSPVRQRVDDEICKTAELPVDLGPSLPPRAAPPAGPDWDKLETEKAISPMERRIFKAGSDVPYSDIPMIQMPSPKAPEAERVKAVDAQFLPLSPLPAEVIPGPGPEGRPLTLNDLQKIALANSPLIRQAAAAVEGARGAAQQTRLYPNPQIGYNNLAVMGPGGGPITGGYISGVIKGPGKIKTAFDAANVDVKTAELALRKAESDLRTSVRDGYFAVLSARENLRVNRAMVKLTDEVYKVMTDQLKKGGVAAVYETMQLRVTALQTRIAYVQAYNRYLAAWKQLAAAVFRPDLPLTELAGRIDSPLPRYQYDKVLAQVLTNHTDALAARMGIGKAESLLRLAQLAPTPDYFYALVVPIDSSPGVAPPKIAPTLSFGVPLPIFDQNQGGIRQAQAALVQAHEEPHRVRSALIGSLADAFERFENNRVQLEMYQRDILPNQIQAFRAVVQRHARGEVGQLMFTDLVTAEQALVSVIGSYLGVLHDMWFAAVDIAALQQTPDLFQVDETIPVAPIPDLEMLCPLDCVHPCPVVPPAPRKGDGYWPTYEHVPARGPEAKEELAPQPKVLPGKDGVPQQTGLSVPVPVPQLPALPTQSPTPAVLGLPAIEPAANRPSLGSPVSSPLVKQ
jgi:cobalt-zinc-cadmium efflux system outer membrane protein